jgi:hypothetical protein
MGAVRHSQRTRARVLNNFRKTGMISISCDEAGVARDCHYDWMKKFPDYKQAFEEAQEGPVGDMLVEEAMRRGLTGVKEPVFNHGKRAADFVLDEKGQVVIDPETNRPKSQPAFVTRYSDRMLELLLVARRRKEFGHKVEATGKDGTALFSLEAARAYMATVPDDQE